jgi:maltose ABC transporter membrane protein/trehalose ABC transporter membrane protein/sucrose ABC transporter membrane protein
MVTSKKGSALNMVVHATVLFLVIMWTIPTAGLFISSIRDKDQLSVSGWWTALSSSEQKKVYRTPSAEAEIRENDLYILRGNLLEGGPGEVIKFGISSLKPEAFEPGTETKNRRGVTFNVMANGDYELSSDKSFRRGVRIFIRQKHRHVSR